MEMDSVSQFAKTYSLCSKKTLIGFLSQWSKPVMAILLSNFPASPADHMTQIWPVNPKVESLLGTFLGSFCSPDEKRQEYLMWPLTFPSPWACPAPKCED